MARQTQDLTFIACDAVIGRPRVPGTYRCPDRADLLTEMARLHIDRAIVRHQAVWDCGPVEGNRVLLEDLAGVPSLLGCAAVTPEGVHPRFDPGRVVEYLVRSGVVLFSMAPQAEQFSPLPWCCGELYAAMQDRRVPLLLDETTVSCDALEVILSAFPDLRIILMNVQRRGRHRMLYRLLARHANLWMCLGPTYAVHEGIEDLCRTFGHDRWVFGTGYPAAEGGAAVTALMYADIPDAARTAIARGNIERCLQEVRT